MGNCETRQPDTEAKYYFNDLDELAAKEKVRAPMVLIEDINKEAMEQRVSLSIQIQKVEATTEHKVELIIYIDPDCNITKSAGFTEKKAKNLEDNIINFQQFFAIPYFFEKEQKLEFRVYTNANNNNYETIQTTLGIIMGSRGQILKKKLANGSEVFINGKEMKKSSKIFIFDISVNGNLSGIGVRYIMTNHGTEIQPCKTKIYESEMKTINKNSNIKNTISFALSKIPGMYLNSSGNAKENIVSIEFNDHIHKQKLGEFHGPISRLLGNEATEVILSHNLKGNIKCEIFCNYSFVSYLKSGMNISLSIGIDFTGSNGHYKDKISYHYLDGGMNNYEKAINSCADIVAHYDSTQCFPVFGFGFRFIDSSLNNFEGKYTDFNYPINCNINDPNIKHIDGVLKEYRNFITKIHLSGPTYFAPLIKDLNFEVNKELKEGKKMHYHILMILTDGQIDDMQETKDALVEASFLPISVIIIGIGNGNFTNMNILDANENPLFDSKNRKADRELVQFVPFNKFKDGNPKKLAEEVLAKIPRQVVDYYQHNNIKPIEDDDDAPVEGNQQEELPQVFPEMDDNN